MAKDRRASITGTYRLNENECIQFTVSMPNAYPDAVAEAKATVLSLLHDELADVLGQTVEDSPATPGPSDVAGE